MSNRRSLNGVHTPTITIFKDTPGQEIDIEANQKHILYLAESGINGALILGSTGEQIALTREERKETIKVICDTLRNPNKNGQSYPNFTIMAGIGGQSIQECVTLANDAAEAGADYAVALPPSFFASCMTNDALEAFYNELADQSKIPIIIYSWPGASSGLEVTSDGVQRLARHRNIVGIKQTDHNVGKMARNVYQTSNEDFYVLAGASDYLIGGLAVGIHGAITGITNFFPRTLLYLYDIFKQGKLEEAKELQGRVSAAEWPILKHGIPGTKFATQYFRGCNGTPRRPLPPAPPAAQEQIKALMSNLQQFELDLVARAKAA